MRALLPMLLLLSILATALPASAGQDFDPNSVTCAEVLRNENGVMELTTLFTYAFLSGLDYRDGNPISPLTKETYDATRAAVENICQSYPEKTVVEMIGIGLASKPKQ